MNVHDNNEDAGAAGIASTIGEPARARMLYCLMDGLARTSTELAVVAEVSPSTASAHLNRLKSQHLVKEQVQGKYRYYTLAGPGVSDVLEGLSVLAGGSRDRFVPSTPNHLRIARTCYDHAAGALGVSLHDRLMTLQWISEVPGSSDNSYEITPRGMMALERMGIDIEGARNLRRRFAFGCLDWSERRCHVGGSLGAALLKLALKKKWVTRHLDSRALSITAIGRREMLDRFGLRI